MSTYSDGHPAPPDFYNLIAADRGCPDGWRWTSVEIIGTDRSAILVRGGVYTEVYKRGPRKGRPNLNKPTPGTALELVITVAERDAFIAQWERETGKCSGCGGCGEAICGSGAGGNTYRTCTRCGGTGQGLTGVGPTMIEEE